MSIRKFDPRIIFFMLQEKKINNAIKIYFDWDYKSYYCPFPSMTKATEFHLVKRKNFFFFFKVEKRFLRLTKAIWSINAASYTSPSCFIFLFLMKLLTAHHNEKEWRGFCGNLANTLSNKLYKTSHSRIATLQTFFFLFFFRKALYILGTCFITSMAHLFYQQSLS